MFRIRLKEEREKRKLTQSKLAEALHLSQSTIGNWEAGKREPEYPTLLLLADYFGVSVDYLLGRETTAVPILNEVELNDTYPIPLLGSVVAGVPLEAQENLEGYIYISYRPKEEYFALRVKGDSMKNAGIFNKSIVICHKQATAESGDIVVAMLNGEHTVKRFKILPSGVFLMPENTDFYPIPVMPTDDFLILGKVIEVRVML